MFFIHHKVTNNQAISKGQTNFFARLPYLFLRFLSRTRVIRGIECTNRQLKNDLNLRPIYHQKDESSDAHLFFGLLAYWVVNTVRYELKQSNIKCYWTEITRRMSTQKLVTTNATNALGEAIVFRQCSCPSKSAKEIYDALKFKHAPFKKIQICRTQS